MTRHRLCAAGARTLPLEGSSPVAEALALHPSAGYAGVAPCNAEPYADHRLEKALTPP